MSLKKISLRLVMSCLVFFLVAIDVVTTSAADNIAPDKPKSVPITKLATTHSTTVPTPATIEPVKPVIIRKVNLKFEDESKVQIVVQNEELHIIAQVFFESSGLLQAEWAVASPTSTAGKLQFNRLSLVNEILALGKVLEIKSPPLPTSITGSYRVRFRVANSKAKLEPVTLGYSVGQASK